MNEVLEQKMMHSIVQGMMNGLLEFKRENADETHFMPFQKPQQFLKSLFNNEVNEPMEVVSFDMDTPEEVTLSLDDRIQQAMDRQALRDIFNAVVSVGDPIERHRLKMEIKNRNQAIGTSYG